MTVIKLKVPKELRKGKVWETLVRQTKERKEMEREVMPECKVCGLRKKPLGRSAPLEMANSLCDYECEGYNQPPYVSDLWPDEVTR